MLDWRVRFAYPPYDNSALCPAGALGLRVLGG